MFPERAQRIGAAPDAARGHAAGVPDVGRARRIQAEMEDPLSDVETRLVLRTLHFLKQLEAAIQAGRHPERHHRTRLDVGRDRPGMTAVGFHIRLVPRAPLHVSPQKPHAPLRG
jgi:hypothetical protein